MPGMSKMLQGQVDWPDMLGVQSVYQKINFLNQNICCGYSKEPSQ